MVWWEIVGSLLGVLGLLILCLIGLRILMTKSPFSVKTSGALFLKDRLYLDAKSSVFLITYKDQEFLISHSLQGTNLLTSFKTDRESRQ
ncbi:MAG TPA: hypothetical protein VI959_00210 [Alphaproteobacteria bacterium]|nr:hypothetical protein [Alphaproteobacteria bacterium]